MATTYKSLERAVQRGHGDKLGRILGLYGTYHLTITEVSCLFQSARYVDSLLHYLINYLERPLPGLLPAVRSQPGLANAAFEYGRVRDALFWHYPSVDQAPIKIQTARNRLQAQLVAATSTDLARYILRATFA